MADDTEASVDPGEPDDVDTGEPVAVLAELRQKPSAGFIARVRSRIERRHLAADTADFSLTGLAFVALQFLTVLFQLFQPNDRQGDQ